MSANGETSVVLRGITHGAVDYLLKPIRIEELRNVWQHVVRRRHGTVPETVTPGISSPPRLREKRGADKAAAAVAAVPVKRRELEVRVPKPGDHCLHLACLTRPGMQTGDVSGPCTKKARVVWTVELHQQFVNAVNALGVDKAVPKRILDLMGVEGLTRENVASHLQKYRLYLKRIQGVQEQQQQMPGLGNHQTDSGEATDPLAMSHLPSVSMSALLCQLPPHPLLPPSLAAELALDDPMLEDGVPFPHEVSSMRVTGDAQLAPLSPLLLPAVLAEPEPLSLHSSKRNDDDAAEHDLLKRFLEEALPASA